MNDSSGFQVARAAADRYERYVGVFMRPLVDALLDVAGVTVGARLLDVACGTGFVARAAAERMGTGGGVTGVDINAAMLAVAREATVDLQVPTEWHEASATQLPFDGPRFTHAVCQQGLQFFPHAEQALREMARVTEPGGTVAVTTWSPMRDSPYFVAQYETLEDLAGPDAVDSFAHAFRLSSADLEQLFSAAGLVDVAVTTVTADVVLPPLEGYAGEHLQATPWGPLLHAGTPDDRTAAFLDGLRSRLAPFLGDDGGTTVPFGTYLARGTVR